MPPRTECFVDIIQSLVDIMFVQSGYINRSTGMRVLNLLDDIGELKIISLATHNLTYTNHVTLNDCLTP